MKRATIILSAGALAAFVFASKADAQPVLEIIEIEGYVYAQVYIPEGPAEVIISFTGLENDITSVYATVRSEDDPYEELIPLGEADLFDESRFITVTITTSETTGERTVSRTWPEEAWVPEESWERW